MREHVVQKVVPNGQKKRARPDRLRQQWGEIREMRGQSSVNLVSVLQIRQLGLLRVFRILSCEETNDKNKRLKIPFRAKSYRIVLKEYSSYNIPASNPTAFAGIDCRPCKGAKEHCSN